jgi:DNA-binding NtrC family response regulator
MLMTAVINPGVYMRTGRRAILCLCHDTDMLQVRGMLLEHFGYHVLSTSSVEDAKVAAKASCPDMLLMDNSYPGIDVEQVARQVKTICPSMLAVVLSPYFGVRAASRGCIDRFVARDEGPDVLIAQIEELFEERGGSEENRPTIM